MHFSFFLSCTGRGNSPTHVTRGHSSIHLTSAKPMQSQCKAIAGATAPYAVLKIETGNGKHYARTHQKKAILFLFPRTGILEKQ